MSKKFSFSLQKLLNYKEQIFESERTILADMNALLARMTEELTRMTAELAERSAQLAQQSRAGITPLEMLTHKNYLKKLEHDIEQKSQQIRLQRKAIDKQMDKVREAKLEVSTMEKLREKKLEEYNYSEAKAEELFIEEFVSSVNATAG